jgi:hypothetical protein
MLTTTIPGRKWSPVSDTRHARHHRHHLLYRRTSMASTSTTSVIPTSPLGAPISHDVFCAIGSVATRSTACCRESFASLAGYEPIPPRRGPPPPPLPPLLSSRNHRSRTGFCVLHEGVLLWAPVRLLTRAASGGVL